MNMIAYITDLQLRWLLFPTLEECALAGRTKIADFKQYFEICYLPINYTYTK